MKPIYISLISLFFVVGSVFGQETAEEEQDLSKARRFFKENTDYQLRAYFGIGGSTPLSMPKEIREIKGYNPGLQLGLEANGTKWVGPSKDWGIRLGISVEGRGMRTKARTKNYITEIIQGNSKIRGYYTGQVRTHVQNTYATIPVSLVYSLNDRWNLYGGVYVSFAIDKQFDGAVSHGYLRKDTPVGEKISFTEDGEAKYDFSDEVQTTIWGFKFGAEWQLKNNRFKLFPEINYAVNGVLQDDFDAISFNLHNIYLDLGFAYQF